MVANDTVSVFAGFPRDAAGREFTPAQTNVQLLEQLRTAALPLDERTELQRAYRLAMELFSGCYRPSGRVFLAHLIGTASIAACFDARNAVIAAGLLHSAYSHGEFGNGVRGATEARREIVRQAVGAPVEARIHRYSAFRWNAKGVQQEIDDLSNADPLQRDVLLIALANSIDDYLDAAAAPGGAAACRDQIRRRGALEVELAAKMELIALADAHAGVQSLALARGRTPEEIPTMQPLRRSIELTGAGSSFVVPPASHAIRTTALMRRLLRRYSPRRPGRALLSRG
jgi:hypothetical protein